MKLYAITVTLLLSSLALAAPAPQKNGQNGQNGRAGNSTTKANGQNSKAGNSTTSANADGQSANTGNNAAKGSGQNTGNQTQGGGSAGMQDGNNDRNQPSQVNQNQALLMQTAIDAWMRDTGVVSNFLNMGASISDEQTFKNQAQIAHSAEVDELTHKAVLDQFMPGNQNTKAANATLSNGAFQLVVDRLEDMATQGRSQVNGIDDINNTRCVNVLPNIDAYMREAAITIGNGQSVTQSVRPAACAGIVAGQNGALKVGQPPANYVNGKLQDRPTQSNTNPNIPATPQDDDPK